MSGPSTASVLVGSIASTVAERFSSSHSASSPKMSPGLRASTSARAATRERAKRAVDTAALRRSRLLWATTDVGTPPDQPDTLGVGGSRPGVRNAHDTMYTRFRLQYLNTAAKAWTD